MLCGAYTCAECHGAATCLYASIATAGCGVADIMLMRFFFYPR